MKWIYVIASLGLAACQKQPTVAKTEPDRDVAHNIQVVLGQKLSDFAYLNRDAHLLDDPFSTGGTLLQFSPVSKVEIVGPGLAKHLQISADLGFPGSLLVSTDTGTTPSVEDVEFHPIASNSSPEVAQKILTNVISVLSDSTCVLISADSPGTTRENEDLPTVAILKTALTSGKTWWRNWNYQCGEVAAHVGIEKNPVTHPDGADGFYMRVTFEVLSKWTERTTAGTEKSGAL